MEPPFWVYLDCEGNARGPFSSMQMMVWWRSSMLPRNLQLRRTTDSTYSVLEILEDDSEFKQLYSEVEQAAIQRQDEEIMVLASMYLDAVLDGADEQLPRQVSVCIGACLIHILLPLGYPECESPSLYIPLDDTPSCIRGARISIWREVARQVTTAMQEERQKSQGECLANAMEQMLDMLRAADPHVEAYWSSSALVHEQEISSVARKFPDALVEGSISEQSSFVIHIEEVPIHVLLPASYPDQEPPAIRVHEEGTANTASSPNVCAWKGITEVAAAHMRSHIFVPGQGCLVVALSYLRKRLQASGTTLSKQIYNQQRKMLERSRDRKPATVAYTQDDVDSDDQESGRTLRGEVFINLHQFRKAQRSDCEGILRRLLKLENLDAHIFCGKPAILHIQGDERNVDSFVGTAKSRGVGITMTTLQRSRGPSLSPGIVMVPASNRGGVFDMVALQAHLEQRNLGESHDQWCKPRS